MKIGYAYWGFLGDTKYDNNGNKISTPDGNAFYSWSIIKGFTEENHEVFSMMPNRDIHGARIEGPQLFSAFAQQDRYEAYLHATQWQESCDGEPYSFEGDCYHTVVDKNFPQIDMLLLEWRWMIPGRNTPEDYDKLMHEDRLEEFQPDFAIQTYLLCYCKKHNIPVVVIDLDYKLTLLPIKHYRIAGVVELGDKWKAHPEVNSKRVEIPFDFTHINDFEIEQADNSCVYVGNRYERDWCIDKYIPNLPNVGCHVNVYGNWNESGRDSSKQWKYINFCKRVQASEMHEVYKNASVTPLLAKREYCENGFMTARILEAVFYGCVPLFIEEFKGYDRYVPKTIGKDLLVKSKDDVINNTKLYTHYFNLRCDIINELREHLKFMDCKYFVKDVLSLIKQ